NGRFAQLDPYVGAQLALCESYRNVATTGALPIAVSDCLNFGSPEDAGVMWQFSQAVDGIIDGCREFGIPVTGGNVSFYNQTGQTAIHPTPVLSVLGVIDDVARRTPSAWSTGGLYLFQLGATREELDGSEWSLVVHEHLGGRPPVVDLDAERALAKVFIEGAREGILESAHDLSQGGLAVALMESVLRYGVGARVSLSDDVFVDLFSESSARAVVSVTPANADALASLCETHGVEMAAVGVTSAEVDGLEVEGVERLSLAALHDAHTSTLPAIFA
ncbi:MAG: AIR synthase related protein, partial [Allobranchiibius sp.]